MPTQKIANVTNYMLALGVTGDYVRLGEDVDQNRVLEAGGLRAKSYTTTERDALTPTNGDIILNTTTNKMQARVNAAWVDLH